MKETHLIARVTEMACAIEGTEAVAFWVEPRDELRLLVHIRPDDATAEMRRKAIEAFRQVVAPCLAAGKDGTIQVEEANRADPQFCVVSLVRNRHAVLGVVAIITRCADEAAARKRLQKVRAIAAGRRKN